MASKSKLRPFLCSTFPEARLVEADATDVDYASGASRKGHFPSLPFWHFFVRGVLQQEQGKLHEQCIFDLLEASFQPLPSQVIE